MKMIAQYKGPLHTPEYCPFRLQTKQFHVIILSPCPPAPELNPCHLHISTGWHLVLVICILTLKMPKPPQSTMPHGSPQPHTEYPSDCTNPHYTFYPPMTLPHIYLTIIRWCSALSRLCRFSAFIGHVSVPYVNSTHDAPRLSGWETTSWTSPKHN